MAHLATPVRTPMSVLLKRIDIMQNKINKIAIAQIPLKISQNP